MTTHPRTARPHRRGSAALEFALTLPLLMVVAFSIAELGLLMHRNQQIARAARDACRIGAGVIEGVDPTGDEIIAASEQAARFSLTTFGIPCDDPLRCRVTARWFEQDDWMMLGVRVSVAYEPLTDLTPFTPRRVQHQFIMLTRQQIVE
jgi:hypothetical protein